VALLGACAAADAALGDFGNQNGPRSWDCISLARTCAVYKANGLQRCPCCEQSLGIDSKQGRVGHRVHKAACKASHCNVPEATASAACVEACHPGLMP
jgi:hypothetical protein